MIVRLKKILWFLVPLVSGGVLSLAYAPVMSLWGLLGVVLWVCGIWARGLDGEVAGGGEVGVKKGVGVWRREFWVGWRSGWLFGVVFYGVNLRWLQTVTGGGQLILAGYLACFWGLLGGFLATGGNPRRVKRPVCGFVLAGVWWMGLEWLRSWLLTGFGWNGLGVAVVDWTWLAQVADVFGVTGYSGLVLWFLLMIAWLGWSMVENFSCGRNFWSGQVRCWVGFFTMLGLVLGYGWWRVKGEESLEVERVRALLVQLNIPQEASRWTVDAEEIRMGYEEETRLGLEEGKRVGRYPDWVVWPEAALEGRLLRLEGGRWTSWENNLATFERVRGGQPPFTLVVGLNEEEGRTLANGDVEADGTKRVWNSLVVMDGGGRLQTFRKHHLVIFGETIPGMDEFPFLRDLYEKQTGVEFGGGYTEGVGAEPLSLGVRGRMLSVIGSVCFEDTVPRLERRFVRVGVAQLILNITNDGWFKESEAAMQHFQNARLRCIELRRPMLRCANTGVTGVVDSSGRVEAKLLDGKGDHFTRGHLLVDVKVPVEPSFSLYAWWGDWPAILGGVGVLVLWFVGFGKREEEGERG